MRSSSLNVAALEALRRRRGWSKRKLAHEAGINDGYYVRISKGMHGASANSVAALASALDVDIAEITDPDAHCPTCGHHLAVAS